MPLSSSWRDSSITIRTFQAIQDKRWSSPSYVMMANGSTKYLSELSSEIEVAVYSGDGLAKIATIGRLKMREDPSLKVSMKSENITGNVILQQAETVRLVTSSGTAISVTELSSGDEITEFLMRRGMRHIGVSVQGRSLKNDNSRIRHCQWSSFNSTCLGNWKGMFHSS